MNFEYLEKLSASEWPAPESVEPRARFVAEAKKEFQKWIKEEEK